MAEAIISGMKSAGLDVNITVSEPITERASYLAETYDLKVAANNIQAVVDANLVVLAVKPQQLGDVAGGDPRLCTKPLPSHLHVDNGRRPNQDDRKPDWMRSRNSHHGQPHLPKSVLAPPRG